MLKIVENDIYLTRGDTAHFDVSITTTVGMTYEILPNDKLTITVRKSINDPSAALIKTVKGVSSLCIVPDDTKDLAFGSYVYDLQLNTASGEVYTIIEPSLFEVMPEVTV